MESKEDIVSGGDTPSNYHTSPRSDVPLPSQTTLALPCREATPIGDDIARSLLMKKRGRPRKYGPDGSVHKSYLPKPVSDTADSAPSAVGNYSSGKRGRGRSGFSGAKQQQKEQMMTFGEEPGRSDGANFTPHVVTVNVGEDITAKIISFCQQGPRGICILSANGMISNATIRQSDSSGGTLTYEGRFEIVNLCGSFTPTEREGTRYREGGLSVSLSSPNGQVVGGCVAGLLIAASPVQIIIGSFLPSMAPEVKPKKSRVQHAPVTPSPFTITSALSSPSNVEKESSSNGHGNYNNNNHSAVSNQNLTSPTSYQQQNWSNTYATPERRVSPTDINVPISGGMQ